MPQTNRLKRLLYQSAHRGCKETDLLLGPFAERHMAALTPAQLETYEQLLGENDWDIWNWVVGKSEPKPQYQFLIAMLRELSPTQ